VDFPARFERVRVAAGISKNALAKAIGISQPFISELESGRKSPSLQTIERICEYLGITLAEFFADDITPIVPADVRRITDMALCLKPRQRKLLIDVIQEWTGSMDKEEPRKINTRVSTIAMVCDLTREAMEACDAIFQADNLAEAYRRLANWVQDFGLPANEALALIPRIHDKYGDMPLKGGKAAEGDKEPGSGLFTPIDGDDNRDDRD
jgi:transcriptional regulator with XRE-family HTH domain